MRACPRCGAVFIADYEFCAVDGARLAEHEDGALVGRAIGRYLPIAPLGNGAAGVVYRARHEFLDAEYALKVLYGDLATEPRARARFRREAVTLARVRHPNVVRIHDFGRTESGLVYVAMEYIDGTSLSDHIAARAPMVPREAADIASQIARGLGELHRLGIVHRDLKPANLMLDSRSRSVKIVDFGLARYIENMDVETRLTRTGHTIGTPGYMSPEQIRASDVGPAADVYALGVVLYEMLAGRLPFRGDVQRILFQHAHSPVPPIGLGGGVADLAMEMLAKHAAERPRAGIVAARLLEASRSPNAATALDAVETESERRRIEDRQIDDSPE